MMRDFQKIPSKERPASGHFIESEREFEVYERENGHAVDSFRVNPLEIEIGGRDLLVYGIGVDNWVWEEVE